MEGGEADEATAAAATAVAAATAGGDMAVEPNATITAAAAAAPPAPAGDGETQATRTATPPAPKAALIPGSRVSGAGPPPCPPTARVADEQELRAWIDSGNRELTPGVWGVLAETAATGFVR